MGPGLRGCVFVCVCGGGGGVKIFEVMFRQWLSWRVRVQRGQKFVQETDQIHFQIKIYIR
jgi:hypothetical protein